MPLQPSDIKFYLSGGAANSDPNASLGGVISSVEVVSSSLHNLFDVVGNSESSGGDTEYRCIYIKNTSATTQYGSPYIGIKTNTPSTSTTIDLAVGTAGVNGTEQTVINESTAPTGVSWLIQDTGSPNLGTLTVGSYRAIWVKRIVSSSAGAYNVDSAIIQVTGTP